MSTVATGGLEPYVYMLSTIHCAECTTVSVRRKTIQTMDKPNCILQYNRQMGGVDKSDQLIEPYDATRKSMRWYKKLSIHLIQLALLNAHIVYRSADSSRRMSFLEFSKSVVTSLLLEKDDTASTSADENTIRLSAIFQRKLLRWDWRQTHRNAVKFATANIFDAKVDMSVAIAQASRDFV